MNENLEARGIKVAVVGDHDCGRSAEGTVRLSISSARVASGSSDRVYKKEKMIRKLRLSPDIQINKKIFKGCK